jgi:2-methylcitrate dehydratase PrpD
MDGKLGPGQLTERRIADPAVMALTKKVTVQPDDALNKMYPDKTASRIEVLMKNGERLSKQVDIPKGDPRDPMEAGDISEKVRSFAGSRDRKKTDRIINAVMELDTLKKIRDLASMI